MAFEGLSDKLQEAFKKLRGKGKLTEKDIKEAMREVKLALLEADVNFKVVKAFISNVSEKCVGSDVLESLSAGQQVIKIVRDELTALMGGENQKLLVSPKPPTIILMCGLQGSGKTTLLNVMSGIDKYASGTIKVDGEVLKCNAVNSEPIKNNKFGYVFQNYYMLDNETVYENLRLALAPLGNPSPGSCSYIVI